MAKHKFAGRPRLQAHPAGFEDTAASEQTAATVGCNRIRSTSACAYAFRTFSRRAPSCLRIAPRAAAGGAGGGRSGQRVWNRRRLRSHLDEQRLWSRRSYKHAVSPASSLFAEVSFAPGKDEREFKFSNYFRSTIPNKANYLLIAPVQIGVQRRLFRNEIENNFRPFLQLGAGPSFGWEYPYFRDCNDDGRFDSNTPCESGETRSRTMPLRRCRRERCEWVSEGACLWARILEGADGRCRASVWATRSPISDGRFSFSKKTCREARSTTSARRRWTALWPPFLTIVRDCG